MPKCCLKFKKVIFELGGDGKGNYKRQEEITKELGGKTDLGIKYFKKKEMINFC